MDNSALFQLVQEALIENGPAILFFACLLETALFAGLVIPVGATIAFSSMLASRGVFSYAELIGFAMSGAFLGDQIGFLIGRKLRRGHEREVKGRAAKVWNQSLGYTRKLLRGRGRIGISLARGVPFVRTVMPWLVGRSDVDYPRFLIFDLLGVCFWAVIYIGGGLVAGQGWRELAGAYGETAGAVFAVAMIILLVYATRQLATRIIASRSAR